MNSFNIVLLTLTVQTLLEAVLLFAIVRLFKKHSDFYKNKFLAFIGVDALISSLKERISGEESRLFEFEERVNTNLDTLSHELSRTSRKTRRIKTVLVNRGIITKRGAKCVFPNSLRGSGRS
jgi:hypothetical protein